MSDVTRIVSTLFSGLSALVTEDVQLRPTWSWCRRDSRPGGGVPAGCQSRAAASDLQFPESVGDLRGPELAWALEGDGASVIHEGTGHGPRAGRDRGARQSVRAVSSRSPRRSPDRRRPAGSTG